MEPENAQGVNNIGVSQLSLSGTVMMPPPVDIYGDTGDVHSQLYSVDRMAPNNPYMPHQHYHSVAIQDYQEPSTSSAADAGSSTNGPQSYDEVFPALPEQGNTEPFEADIKLNGEYERVPYKREAGSGKGHQAGEKEKKGKGNNIVSANDMSWRGRAKPIRSTQVTQTFCIPPEERRYKDQSVFRDPVQVKTCQEIMQKTGTRIEMSCSKDGKLSFLISGKEDAVAAAWKLLSAAVQVKGERSIPVPKEHHKFILGKNGTKLRDLENSTNTRIAVPRQDDTSNAIRISGTRDAIERAIQEIQSISHEAACKASEKICIPKFLHPFIRGPSDETMNAIINECGGSLKINIPPDPSNEMITLMGEPSAICVAKSKIMEIYEDKKSKVSSVKMEVKKAQHKYILGRGGQTQKEIFKQTGVYVEIPPQDQETDTITLWGESDKIGPALQVLYEKAHSELEEEIETESWIHRHILGPKGANFHEMNQSFANVRVSFEEDGKIRMRGPRNELPIARRKLEEEIKLIKSRISILEMKIDAKYHRFVIGKSGKQIQSIRDESKAKIQIPEESDHSASSNIVRIEGSEDAVKRAKEMIDGIIVKQKERESEVTKEVNIDQRFHRHFIGSKGEKIREIREKFNQVQVTFPPPESKLDAVCIRGSVKDVEGCIKYLAQETRNLQAQHYRTEVPVSTQYLKFLTREREKIQQIKSATKVRIDLPPLPASFSSFSTSTSAAAATSSSSFSAASNANAISSSTSGSASASSISAGNKSNESKLSSSGGAGNDVGGQNCPPIVISGKKEDCEKAKEMMQKLLSGLTDYKQYDVYIPSKLHNMLIGTKGRQIKSIKDECPGVDIIFPPENSGSDKISIIGPQECALKAKQMLMEVKNERQENSYEEKVKAKPELHSLIRRKSSALPSLSQNFSSSSSTSNNTATAGSGAGAGSGSGKRAERGSSANSANSANSASGVAATATATNSNAGYVRLLFPTGNEDNRQDRETIIISGKRPIVMKVKEELESMIKELEKTVVDSVKIPVQHHAALKKGLNMRQIKEDLGDIQINFPKEGGEGGAGSDETITIRGAKECVETAKRRLKEKADELEAQIIMNVEILQQYHKILLRSQGKMVQNIQNENRVEITFPKKGGIEGVAGMGRGNTYAGSRSEHQQQQQHQQLQQQHHALVNGSLHDDPQQQQQQQQQSKECDIITLKGRKENCEAAKKALLSLIPISQEIEVPYMFHKFIIGQRGVNIKEIKDKYDVAITVPPSEEQNDKILVKGLKVNVEEAIEAIKEKVQKLIEGQQDRELKSYRLDVKVEPMYHSKIIGKGGKVVTKIKKDCGVQIQFPEKNDQVSDVITVVGYEADTIKARDAILEIVHRLENMVTEEIEIDSKVHPRLIGAKGRQVGRIMDKFKVEVKFPKENSSNPDLVIITGESENVEQAKDHLLSLADDYLDDVVEQYRPPKKVSGDDDRPKGDNRGFYVKGGPWEQSNCNNPQVMPDTSNADEFPSMCGGGGDSNATSNTTGGTAAAGAGKVGGWGIGGSKFMSTPRPNI